MFTRRNIEDLLFLYESSRDVERTEHTESLLRGLAAQALDPEKRHTVVVAGTQQNASRLERRFRAMLPEGADTSYVSFSGVPSNQYVAGRVTVFVWDNYPLTSLLVGWIGLDNARIFIEQRYAVVQQLYHQEVQEHRRHKILIERLALENERLALHSGNDVY